LGIGGVGGFILLYFGKLLSRIGRGEDGASRIAPRFDSQLIEESMSLEIKNQETRLADGLVAAESIVGTSSAPRIPEKIGREFQGATQFQHC